MPNPSYVFKVSEDARDPSRGKVEFLASIKALGPVEEVICLDLMGSFLTIFRERLLCELRRILPSPYLMGVVECFVNLEIPLPAGEVVSEEAECQGSYGIPAVGLFSDVLLNLYLSSFDRDLTDLLEKKGGGRGRYLRFLHTAVIAFPDKGSWETDIFQKNHFILHPIAVEEIFLSIALFNAMEASCVFRLSGRMRISGKQGKNQSQAHQQSTQWVGKTKSGSWKQARKRSSVG